MKHLTMGTRVAHQDDLQALAALVRERESNLMCKMEEWGLREWESTEWFLRGCEYQEK